MDHQVKKKGEDVRCRRSTRKQSSFEGPEEVFKIDHWETQRVWVCRPAAAVAIRNVLMQARKGKFVEKRIAKKTIVRVFTGYRYLSVFGIPVRFYVSNYFFPFWNAER